TAGNNPVRERGRNVGSLEPLPGMARMALQIGVGLDPAPHEILPSPEDLADLPDVLIWAIRALAPPRIEPWRPAAQPVVGIHERKVVLKPAVKPKAGQLRGLVVLRIIA